MGNKQITTFQKQPWQLHQTEKKYILLKNKNSQQIVQKHTTYLQRSNRNLQEELYKWRSNLLPQSYVVQMFQYGICGTGICNNLDESYVITENIERFNKVRMLSKPQCFLFIKHILIGLENLKDKVGLFLPNEKLIGINQSGKGRVWVNQNFAINTMENNIHTFLDEESVTNHVIELVASKISRNICPHVYFPFNMKFRTAIQYIENIQMKQNGFFIDRITLLKGQLSQETLSRATQSKNILNDYLRNSKLSFHDQGNSNKQIIRFASQDKVFQMRNPYQPLFIIQQQKQSSILSSNINNYGINSMNQHSLPLFSQSKVDRYHNSPSYHKKSNSKDSIHSLIINPINGFQSSNKPISIQNLIRNVKPLQMPKKIIPQMSSQPFYQQQNHNRYHLIASQKKHPISIHQQLKIKENLEQVYSEIVAPQEE